jgi:hypothetical protein
MDNGGTGVPFLTAASLAEEGIRLRLDSATTHPLPMEEPTVSGQIPIPLLAIMCLVVKNLQKIKNLVQLILLKLITTLSWTQLIT